MRARRKIPAWEGRGKDLEADEEEDEGQEPGGLKGRRRRRRLLEEGVNKNGRKSGFNTRGRERYTPKIN